MSDSLAVNWTAKILENCYVKLFMFIKWSRMLKTRIKTVRMVCRVSRDVIFVSKYFEIWKFRVNGNPRLTLTRPAGYPCQRLIGYGVLTSLIGQNENCKLIIRLIFRWIISWTLLSHILQLQTCSPVCVIDNNWKILPGTKSWIYANLRCCTSPPPFLGWC